MKPLTKEAFVDALKRLYSDSGKLSPVAILDALPAIMDGLKVRMLLEHGINIQDDAPIDPTLLSITKDNKGRGKSFMDVVAMLYREHYWGITKKELNARNINAIIRKGKLAEVAKSINRIITYKS